MVLLFADFSSHSTALPSSYGPSSCRCWRSTPDIKIDINLDYSMTNIVEQRFDAGARLGKQVEKDMIAVRIGADMRMAVVAATWWLATSPEAR